MNLAILKSIFRFFGFLEGGSLLLLLFVAMPYKYIGNQPDVVSVVGAIHGFLFTVYLVLLAWLTLKVKWNWKWPVAGFIVAFLPFGTFIYDHYFVRSKYY